MMWIVSLLVRRGFSQRVSKLVAYLGSALLVAALLGALWLWLDSHEKADDIANQEIGADRVEAESMAETLDQLERADDAEEDLTRDPDARLASCRLHSRTPENCRP